MLLRKLAKELKAQGARLRRAPLRLAFMGSPDFAVPALRALHAAGHEIAAVYCQPPRPAGRGQQETPCPVHRAALDLGLPVRTPGAAAADAAEHAAFAALGLDVGGGRRLRADPAAGRCWMRRGAAA